MIKKTLSVISLGCFRNTYDSEVVLRGLLDKGRGVWQYAPTVNNCDCLLINTCGFIDDAKKESLGVIEEAVKLRKKNKIKKLIVMGCLVQRYREDLEKLFPDVDEWRGVGEFGQLFRKRAKLTPPHVDFLKICEGCINKCSYCSISMIKGPLCSRPKEEVLREVRFLDKSKVKELNIIGQDITSWGKDLGEKNGLTALLKSVLKETKNIRWLRLLYTHPKHFPGSLIDLIAGEDKICKYIDLPIQHINDRILKLMNRRVSRKEIVKLIEKIRKKIPDCIIRTSVMVGFPTETEKEFKELLKFLKDVKFERLGAFIYSRQEGTAAYNLKQQVHYQKKMRRFREVMALQQKIAQEANSRFLGSELDILIEEKNDDGFFGRSQYDAYEVDGEVFLKNKNLKIGDFYRAKITDVYGYDLVGE
jgi:ribosomal protein S12 methylthiotransferase